MTTIEDLIKKLKTMRKGAEWADMVFLVDEIDNTIADLQTGKSVPLPTNATDRIQLMADTAIRQIESMSTEEISKANNSDAFKRYPNLPAMADISIGILESDGIDSRDLSIAFDNEFTYTPNTKTYEAHTKMFDDVSKNGMYVIDVPHDQILSAMSQMEYFARKKSPKWVKSNFKIPKKAYETHESFLKFMKRFYKKHGMFWAE